MSTPMPSVPADASSIRQTDEDVRAVTEQYDRAMTGAMQHGTNSMSDRHRIGCAWHRYRDLHPQADDHTTEGH